MLNNTVHMYILLCAQKKAGLMMSILFRGIEG